MALDSGGGGGGGGAGHSFCGLHGYVPLTWV